MIKILVNKKIIEYNELNNIVNKFKHIYVDLGTGNGKFIYDLAKNNPDKLYIGVEPTASNLYDYSKKVSKNKIENLIFIITSIENMGDELNGLADKVYINFPWGSLLEATVKDMPVLLNKISRLGKVDAEFIFIFAYNNIHEPVEIEKRQLPELSSNYLLSELKEIYKKANLSILSCTNLEPHEIKNFGTLWAKKLFLGKSRDVYRIISKKININT